MYQGIARIGGSGSLTTVTRPLYDPDAINYFKNVEGFDQYLELSTKNAINNFIIGCKNDNIWNSLQSCCILAGARTLQRALVPLKGVAPTNFNFINSDYNRASGLKGNGTSKYLNSNRKNNSYPRDDVHISVYITSNTTSNSEAFVGTLFNATSAPQGAVSILKFTNNTTFRLFGRNSSAIQINFMPSTGFKGLSRNNNQNFNFLIDSSVQTFTPLASQIPDQSDLFVFAGNNLGTPILFTDSRISFYSIGTSLNLALLKARVDTLMSNLSGLQ